MKISGNCPKCGTWRRKLQREHIIPRFEGGGDEPENIQFLCANCHEDKTYEDMKRWKESPEQRERRLTKIRALKRTPEHNARIKVSLQKRYEAVPHHTKGRQLTAGEVQARYLRVTNRGVLVIRQMLANGKTIRQVSEYLSLSYQTVRDIRAGTTYQWVEETS